MTSNDMGNQAPEIAIQDIEATLNNMLFSPNYHRSPLRNTDGRARIVYHSEYLTQGISPEEIPTFDGSQAGSKEYWRRVAIETATISTLVKEAGYGDITMEPGEQGGYWYSFAIDPNHDTQETIEHLKQTIREFSNKPYEEREPFLNNCIKRFESSNLRTNHLLRETMGPHGSNANESTYDAVRGRIVQEVGAREHLIDPAERSITVPPTPDRL